MTLDLFNTKEHEQMRCGFFHRECMRLGFIGVESTLNPRLAGFYSFADIEQVKTLRQFLEDVEKEYEKRNQETNPIEDRFKPGGFFIQETI